MINTEFILKSTGGKLLSGNAGTEFQGISIDSRRVKKNDLFIAIKGDNHDGHDFISEAFKNGAAGAIIDKTPKYSNEYNTKNIIKVSSTTTALGKVANAWRNNFPKL
ncbi:MAG: Mur ligase domain-containing protein, partial [Thermodesulfobacteriota bacterium]